MKTMLLAAAAIRVGIAVGYLRAPASIVNYTDIAMPAHSSDPNFLATALSILFVLNLLLGTFNLLPIPPLDGHTGIMLLMPESTALRYLDWTRRSGFAMIGLLIAWTAFDKVFQVIFMLALRLLYPSIHYS